MKTFLRIILSLALIVIYSCSEDVVIPRSDFWMKGFENATPAQKSWLNLKYGMFIHFGTNTYQMKTWGNGQYDITHLDFTSIDVKQWAEAARDAGMKYAVLTTKHHDGFCLWHSAYTNYCTKKTASPYIDIVRLFVDEFRKAGLKVGLYYSLWDRNNPDYYDKDDAKYIQYMKNQLKELLTNYGDILEIWFDGAWDRDYPHICQDTLFMQLLGKKVLAINDTNNQHEFCWMYSSAYQSDPTNAIRGARWNWKVIYDYIHSLQPNCLVINNSSMNWKGGVKYLPVDIRTCEQFDVVLPSTITIYNDLEQYNYTDVDKKVYIQLEFTTSITPAWFWTGDLFLHPSVDEIVGWYRTARKYNGNFLLNVGPDNTGKIPSYHVDYLKKAGDILRQNKEIE